MKKNHRKFLIFIFLFILIKLDADENVNLENCFNTLNSNERYSVLYISIEITLSDDIPLYSIKNDNVFIVISYLMRQEKIKIIAKAYMPYSNIQYYLVKKINDNNLWSGWISATDVTELKEIENKSTDKGYLKTMEINCVSEDNQYIAFHTGHMGEYFIMDQNREIKFQLSYSDLMKEYIDATDGAFLGWSTDSTKIWFMGYTDVGNVCFGIVDITTNTYILFNSPENCERMLGMDYDTGDAFYTDYPYQFDHDTWLMTAQSGKVFHLFKYNFFTSIEIEICQNVGVGFTVRKKEGVIFYNRNDNPYNE
jgi:hypothetical protein